MIGEGFRKRFEAPHYRTRALLAHSEGLEKEGSGWLRKKPFIKKGMKIKRFLLMTIFMMSCIASNKTNELFAYMGRYVSLREQLDTTSK